MIRTTWMLFANWKCKHHINKKEYNDDQQSFNRTATQTSKNATLQNNKQQVNTVYVIRYKRKTQVPKYKQSYITNKLLWNIRIQTILQKWCCLQTESTTIKLNKRETTTNKHCSTETQQDKQTAYRTNNKQQTSNSYVIAFKRKETNKTQHTNNQTLRTSCCANWRIKQ